MKKGSVLFIILNSLFIILPPTASAMCPICTVAVAGGLGLSRWLGIDDTVSSLWIGGLILSSSLWFSNWFQAKNFKTIKQFNNLTVSLVISFITYGLVLIPLFYYEVVGHPLNKIFGIDKLIFGTIVGSLGFLLGMWLDKKIRKAKGRQLFNYQRVVFPVGTLLILSAIFYFSLPYLQTT